MKGNLTIVKNLNGAKVEELNQDSFDETVSFNVEPLVSRLFVQTHVFANGTPTAQIFNRRYDEILFNVKKEIESIIKIGINVYIEREFNDKFIRFRQLDNPDIGFFQGVMFKCYYGVKEIDFYKVSFMNGVTDKALKESVEVAKKRVNRQIDEIVRKHTSKK